MKDLTPLSNGSLLEPEYADSFQAWKAAPGPPTNAALLKQIDPVIQGAIRTHVGEPNPLLVSRARRMAIDGMGGYDPMKGRLQTYMYGHLQGLKRVNRQQTQILKVPERVQLDRYQLDRMVEELTHELGREPTDGELTDRTGFSTRRLARIRSYNPAVAEGAMVDPETGAEYTGETRSPQAEANRVLLQMVYDDLDPYHQKVMELSMGLNGRQALPNHIVAEQMRRSPGAISQAKERIQRAINDMGDLL